MDKLWLLVILACPVGMALMMFVMMRGKGDHPRDRRDRDES